MLSISTGHSAGYLTSQVGAGRESYYTGAVAAGEPPGRWWGTGADLLGLVGEVDAEVMDAVYGEYLDPRDPVFADPVTRLQSARLGRAPKRFRSPEDVVEDRIRGYTDEYATTPTAEQIQAWRIQAERDTPKAVGFYDATFSPDKSVTVLWVTATRAANDAAAAGDQRAAEEWRQVADIVEDAVAVGAGAGLAYLQDKACIVRTGRHGTGSHTGRFEDGGGFVIARFLQHDSRDHDPQLHIHQAILNKTLGADGQWRSVDSKAIHAARPAAAVVSERTMEALLTERLGIAFEMREDGVGRRVEAIMSELEDLFSSRTQAINPETARRIDDYEQAIGRPANRLEKYRLSKAATMATRRAKTHDGESTEEQHLRWAAEAAAGVAGGLSRQRDKLDRAAEFRPRASAPAGRAERWSPEAVTAQALEAVHGPDGRSTWTAHDLTRQIDLALPANLGLSSEDVPDLLERLTSQALAQVDAVVQVAGHAIGTHQETRASDRTAVTVAPSAVRYATRGHLAAELAVLDQAGVRGRHRLDGPAIDEWLAGSDIGATLSPAQAAALRGIATSDAALSVLVGPAGTGKSYAAGVLDAVWRHHTPGGRVIGIAPTQVAAEVLADDGVVDTANAAAFLAAHARLAAGRGLDHDDSWRLGSHDLVLVDEASMLDTQTLTRLQEAVDQAGARLVLMGDPHQLQAVGASGMMAAAIGRDAETYTLAEVRRFDADWEREASLRLRDGDIAAVLDYDTHGRILDAGTESQAIAAIARAAAADIFDGRDTVVVTATNEHAAAVSAAVRSHLVAASMVEPAGVLLGRDGTAAGVGDIVQARRIDHTLGLVNRETYRIDQITAEGSLHVTSCRTDEPRTIPAAYVDADLTLAYASTAHGAQGRTVGAGHVLLTPHLDRAGAYVGLTRGRGTNTAWAITTPVGHDPAQPQPTSRGLLAAAVAADSAAVNARDAAAVDIAAADHELRTNAGTLLDLIENETRIATRARLERALDQLVDLSVLAPEIRTRLGAEQGTEHLSRLLRTHEQAGHEPAAVLREAVEGRRSLQDARDVSHVLATRIGPATAQSDDPAWRIPAEIDQAAVDRIAELHRLLDDRRTELGRQVAADPPDWAITTLGELPTDQDKVSAWTESAGVLAAYREATEWADDEQPIGRCPGVHTPEKRAAWGEAYTAAGRPEHRRPEAQLPDGQLHTRVRAAELAQNNAPLAVHEQLRDRRQSADRARRDAAHTRARGNNEAADKLEQLAETHQASAERLNDARNTRNEYLAYYAETLRAGDSARTELITRGKNPGEENDRTTASEWLQARRTAEAEDEQHRAITETDVHDRVDDPHEPDHERARDETEIAAATPSPTAGPRPAHHVAEEAATPEPSKAPSGSLSTPNHATARPGHPDTREKEPEPPTVSQEQQTASAAPEPTAQAIEVEVAAATRAKQAREKLDDARAQDTAHEAEQRDREARESAERVREQQSAADHGTDPAHAGGYVLEVSRG
jgi:TrwC relaxase/AAA domain